MGKRVRKPNFTVEIVFIVISLFIILFAKNLRATNSLKIIIALIILSSVFSIIYRTVKYDRLKSRLKERMGQTPRDEEETLLREIKLDDLNSMSGVEFEELIIKLFNKMGYNAHGTKTTGDQGVDVIATKDDQSIAIQAKRYRYAVGNSAIQQVVAGKPYYNATECMVITNSYFTKGAIELAKVNNVTLWDGEKLVDKLFEYKL